MKSLVIVNPQAANGKCGRNWNQWQTRLQQTIGPYDFKPTTYAGHAEVLAREGLQQGYDHIHAVGGDGTVSEVITGFFQEGRAINPDAWISVWPGGTACDFYRGLLQPDVFQSKSPDNVTPIDVGRITFLDHNKNSCERYFLNITSCGISGFVDQLMARKWKNLGGRMGFLVNTVEGLVRYDNRKVRIKTDRGDLGEMLVRVAVIANGKFFGAGMKIAPDALIDDGKFQLVVIGDVSVVEALLHTPRLYSGEHMSHPKVQTQNVTWVELTSDDEVLIDLDGEPAGTLPMRAQIMPAAIKLRTY